jgi:kynurenine formamidase
MAILDLTMPLDERTPVFPGDPKQEIVQIATIAQNGWNEKRLTFNTHFSTHIDAPYHMLPRGKKLSEYPIETFIGKAIVLDLDNPELDAVEQDDIVFLYTGHTKKAYTADFFIDNPIISEELAHALIKKHVRIVGLDSYTPDNDPYPVHKLLFQHHILIVENLINLHELRGKRFECTILPLKLAEDGGPCRVVARF